jgi:pimeloyl-ACP methyl ester carboxylesterase
MVDRILDLADGRRLGYSEWGPVDAPPIIYCHGFPSNRRELDQIQPALDRPSKRVEGSWTGRVT